MQKSPDNEKRLLLLVPININCSQNDYTKQAVDLVNRYGADAFIHTDLYNECSNSSLPCAILSVLTQSEGMAARMYTNRLDNVFSESHHIAFDYVNHLLSFLKSKQNKTLTVGSQTLNVLVSDLFNGQDNVLHDLKLPFRQRHPTHMAAIALYDGTYVGHVYIHTKNLHDIRMIGIRKSLTGHMMGSSAISYTILRGLQLYATLHEFKNIIIDGVPIGAMVHIAKKCGFREYDSGYIVPVRHLGTIFMDMEMITILDMGCRIKKRGNMSKFMTNKWFAPILNENVRRDVISFLMYIILPNMHKMDSIFAYDHIETDDPPLKYIFSALHSLSTEENTTVFICNNDSDMYNSDNDDDIFNMFCNGLRNIVQTAYTDINQKHLWNMLQQNWIRKEIVVSNKYNTDVDVQGLDDDDE